MVGTSKILTVSYGTFSCTLEGFDESFNTMKAIAEYFRDLAADDRYFGAEPPTPDADMLARIAEKEIARRVEARMDDSGIVLRPALAQSTADAPPEMTPSRGETSSAAIAAASVATSVANDVAPVASEEPADETTQETYVDETAEETAERPSESEAPDVAEQVADLAEEGETGSEAPEAKPSDVLAAEDPVPTISDEAVVADTARDEEPAIEASVETPTEVPAHPDADSVAAKLQRIRAVVGTGRTEAGKSQDSDDFSEDLTEAFYDESETPDVADVAAHADAEMAEEHTPGMDMISRVMARHGTEDNATEADPSDAAEMSEVEESIADEVPVDAPPAAPRVVRIKRSDLEAALADQADDTEEEAVNDDVQGPDLGMLDGADELDGYLEDDDAPLSAEEEAEMMEAVGDWNDTDETAEAEEADEVEEAVEIDEVEEDVTEDQSPVEADDAETDETGEAATEHRERPGRAIFDSHPDEDEDGLNRLLTEADAQMQEPEGNRRRAAIEQLKAAVAATEASRQAGDADVDDGKVENAFRDDLSQAVRPRRAPRRVEDDEHQRTERPRPAPLKLVASQRVDLENAAKDGPVTPVRPRRVARTERKTETSAESFADFAEQMGAKELPDLLEAAAAYTSFVEGADEFSRPQIMRRVRAVANDDFNREDGLRSFADLLRQGRITKISNGRFQIAEDTRFHPERRAS